MHTSDRVRDVLHTVLSSYAAYRQTCL